MMVMAVDTAFAACSVAIVSDAKLLAHCLEPMERGHAEALAPMVEKAVRESGTEFAALERLGVTVGPGTFTGIRVGVAFMRGLRLALQIPLVGVTSLEVMAHEAMNATGLPHAAAVNEARSDEIYFELVGEGSNTGPLLLSLTETAAKLVAIGARKPVALAGDAQERLIERVGERLNLVATPVRVPDALWVARLTREAHPGRDVPAPLYLRPPAARLPGADS